MRGLRMWMEGLSTQKLGGAASNTSFSPVRILLLLITAAILGIFVLIRSTSSAGVQTIDLEIALETCLHENKAAKAPDFSPASAPTETTTPIVSEKKKEEKSDRVLGMMVSGNGQVAGLQRDLCGMGEEELAAALRLPHETKKKKNRYLYNGAWYNFWHFFTIVRNAVDGPPVVCVVVHVVGQMPCRHSPGGCVLHFHVRPKDSDLLVVEQLIEKEDFKGLDPHAEYDTILDAGGSCGIASVLFATQYPKARIVSVEPSQSTFDMLRMNTEQFPNVMAIHAGVWNRESKLALFASELGSWAIEVKEVKKGEDTPANAVATLDGVSIPYLLRLSSLDHFDFMKIDIEGSELQVFDKTDASTDLSYLEKVRLVVCEIHDGMRRGARASVMNAFSSGFNHSKTGEYVMFTRQKE
eukprot:TRINITY_DN2502_c1_g1_i5.p1 TRINITY_DN2502_c1_g1~~TRINITY_DN2502_c1_g1_i5.p1  ORF type:complete len:411 (+),score=73.86 TRINITY_DN2502_c1_g1_i5:231-1463(+)